MVTLAKALHLDGSPRLGFVGAGGKTIAMAQLSRELKPPLVISTTTHLGTWQTSLADHHWLIEDQSNLDFSNILQEGVTLVTRPPEGDRLPGPEKAQLDTLADYCRVHKIPLLLECDGSRQRPLKVPASHEPMIPEFLDLVVVVAGLSGLGKPLDEETAYNPDDFATLSGLKLGQTVTTQAVADVLCHESGGLKDIPSECDRVCLLNQADTEELQSLAASLARKVMPAFNAVIIASLKNRKIIARLEHTAGIILAGGSSSRLGQPKQLVNFQGNPLIQHTISTSVSAGLSPVIVVTGAYEEIVREAIGEWLNKVSVVHNPDWQEGQASSIRAAVNHLVNRQNPHKPAPIEQCLPGSAVFLLADQPMVSVAVIRALIEAHSQTLTPVIAPLVEGRRGNPVLMDRSLFPDLLALSGDVGGRAIFSKYPPHYIQWFDDSILKDIDTPADLEAFLVDYPS